MVQCVVGIVQARMGASRLPNKMMLSFHGYPIIEWIYHRVSKSKKLDTLVFAVPETPQNDILEHHLTQLGAQIVRGSEHDVLDRIYQVAVVTKATHIVRICGDNPFVSPDVIDDLVTHYFLQSCDYAYNHIPRGNLYPDGLGAEIVSMELLKTIWTEAEEPSQREHVFNYIWDHQGQFQIQTFDPADSRLAMPDLKLDIDTFDDYKKLLSIPVHIKMSSLEIVSLCKGNL